MNAPEGTTKIIYADIFERDKIIGQQIGENYRLCSEKRLTNQRVAMIFVPIIFKDAEEPSPEVKSRFWEVRNKIDGMAVNKKKMN